MLSDTPCDNDLASLGKELLSCTSLVLSETSHSTESQNRLSGILGGSFCLRMYVSHLS